MIEQPQFTGRARPYPQPTVLRAIARTMMRPGVELPEVRHMKWIDYAASGGADLSGLAEFPAATLHLETGRVADLAAWAAVLMNVRVEVSQQPGWTDISVIGRTSSGPVVSVFDQVTDWPLELAPGRTVMITADELAAVVADVRSADALAGAR